jgi:hypothetical protein
LNFKGNACSTYEIKREGFSDPHNLKKMALITISVWTGLVHKSVYANAGDVMMELESYGGSLPYYVTKYYSNHSYD